VIAPYTDLNAGSYYPDEFLERRLSPQPLWVHVQAVIYQGVEVGLNLNPHGLPGTEGVPIIMGAHITSEPNPPSGFGDPISLPQIAIFDWNEPGGAT
jgi:hypothetical protein